ncbi:MAG: cofactor-independent phosphoglycerate mutase [Bacteroides sp.]|nr:cofactor-independent phosphoglycerate mutase [Roseburia sp.]MCM1345918.1 cofactor-independent phosphoglycerate mutase [Bacteroides sp.]MCM1420083.1 cofactor-independent phosphoglycerate mutase [Bacteroides sp.]
MKHIIILGDGMADWKVEALGDKTLMQYAHTPYMDMLAKKGRTGMLTTVPEGFHPGSEVANSSILGYDQTHVYEGRGPLEAASIGVELSPDDMAIRCNLVCIEGDCIKNHSAGHLKTEEGDVLIKYLQERLGTERVHFYTGVQYRHLLVIKGGDKRLSCTPPHDVPGQPWRPLLVKPEVPEAQATADLLNDLILKSQQLLAGHPLNQQRVAEGKDPANSIWPWAGGYRPDMVPLTQTYPQIKRGAVITAVDLIRGIGHYAGLRCIDVEGATGLADTNYEGKAEAAIAALKTDDFVYLHIEASDEAGHDGKLDLKLATIESLDKRAVRPIWEYVEGVNKAWEEEVRANGGNTADTKTEPVAIAVLPDHPTPVKLRTHTNEPVPFLIYAPGIEADGVDTFDEYSCKQGGYGCLKKDEFIKAFMNL